VYFGRAEDEFYGFGRGQTTLELDERRIGNRRDRFDVLGSAQVWPCHHSGSAVAIQEYDDSGTRRCGNRRHQHQRNALA
jgi:hypothetical protein